MLIKFRDVHLSFSQVQHQRPSELKIYKNNIQLVFRKSSKQMSFKGAEIKRST